jgi:hypothetical protein
MTRIRLAGVVVTVLVALALVAGGGVAESVGDGAVSPTDGRDTATLSGGVAEVSGDDDPRIALNESEVGLELTPTTATAAPGETVTYDIVITEPSSGISAYSFNLSVADPSLAAIDNFTLDRSGFFDSSFITEDNSTLALDVGLGDQRYSAAPEVTIATMDVEVLDVGNGTTVDFSYDPDESVLDNNDTLYTVAEDQSGTLTIDAPPEFLVSNLTPADASVVEGETLNISADVTNVGEQGAQTVSLGIDGLTRNRTVTLANDKSTTVTFEGINTSEVGAGEYQHTVSTANESVSGNLTVLASATFGVEITETTTPVAGENLSVTALVTNEDSIEATQTITLDAGPLGGTSTNVTLGGGNSTEQTLSVATGPDAAGEYTATVASDDDTASANVTVLAPAVFDVSITETSTPVTGEDLTVTVSVENTGEATATQTVELDAGGLGTDSTNVSLAGGNTTETALAVSTVEGDAGEYSVTVSSANDTETANVTVLAAAEFSVGIAGATTPVEGENLTVTAVVENTGDVEGTQTVALDAGELGTDSTNLTLSGGNVTETALTVSTGGGDAGEYTVTVSSADDSAAETVTVEQPASFQVTLTNVTDAVGEGETVTAAYEVTNTGDVQATQNVTFAVDGTTEATAAVTLSAGETFEGTFSYETTAADVPGLTLTVSSADDAASANVTVLVPAEFTVDIVETSAPLVAGGELNLTVLVANVGGAVADATVQTTWQFGGSNTTVTLADGESTNLTVTLDSTAAQTGFSNVTVAVGADSAATAVELYPTSLPNTDSRPLDPDGDDRYEDVDGEGGLTIFDVQSFFVQFDSEAVQQHALAYNFDGQEPAAVTIFDVQSLFLELAG